MKNYEKYMEEYIRLLKLGARCDFVQNYVLKSDCLGMCCSTCHEKVGKWFEQEYEPQIDWSKVPVNTPVLVKDETYNAWKARYFVTYLPTAIRQFAVFDAGATHETANAISQWECCKLAREEDIEKYSI